MVGFVEGVGLRTLATLCLIPTLALSFSFFDSNSLLIEFTFQI